MKYPHRGGYFIATTSQWMLQLWTLHKCIMIMIYWGMVNCCSSMACCMSFEINLASDKIPPCSLEPIDTLFDPFIWTQKEFRGYKLMILLGGSTKKAVRSLFANTFPIFLIVHFMVNRYKWTAIFCSAEILLCCYLFSLQHNFALLTYFSDNTLFPMATIFGQ